MRHAPLASPSVFLTNSTASWQAWVCNYLWAWDVTSTLPASRHQSAFGERERQDSLLALALSMASLPFPCLRSDLWSWSAVSPSVTVLHEDDDILSMTIDKLQDSYSFDTTSQLPYLSCASSPCFSSASY